MRTKVFAYKGVIGIESSVDAEGLLNKPLESGQLGFVLNSKCVDISKEALELLKKVKPSGDDIGDVDIFKADDNRIIFCWLGRNKKEFKPEDATGSSEYNPSLIKKTKKWKYQKTLRNLLIQK